MPEIKTNWDRRKIETNAVSISGVRLYFKSRGVVKFAATFLLCFYEALLFRVFVGEHFFSYISWENAYLIIVSLMWRHLSYGDQTLSYKLFSHLIYSNLNVFNKVWKKYWKHIPRMFLVVATLSDLRGLKNQIRNARRWVY